MKLAALAAAVLCLAGAQDEKPIRALLVLGGCCHDYAKQKDLITQGVSARAKVEWTVSYDPDKGTKHLNPVYEKDDWAAGFDVVVHDECCSDMKDPAMIERILKPHREGLPGVVLHCGMHSYRYGPEFPRNSPWFEFTGLATTNHGPQVPIAVTYLDQEHPVTKGLEDWTTVNEELYNNQIGKLHDSAHALARGKQVIRKKDGTEQAVEHVVTWVNTYAGKTRVFATTLGHNNATVGDPRYLELVTRGLLWSVGRLPAASK
jgi:type 1 glutamine amidotransferase